MGIGASPLSAPNKLIPGTNLTGMGIYKSRQVKIQENFAVAGRSLSPWIMVCTILDVRIGNVPL